MIIGHLAAGMALKPKNDSIPLWTLVTASLLVDLVAMVLVMLGLERMEPQAGLSEINSMSMFMPYTHSLVLTPLWMLGGALLYKAYRREASARDMLIIALAVASHWLLDFISHIPDLPIFFSQDNVVGLGLWNSAFATKSVEIALLLVGTFIFLRARSVRTPLNKVCFVALFIILAYLTVASESVPLRNTGFEMAVTGLTLFTVILGLTVGAESPFRRDKKAAH